MSTLAGWLAGHRIDVLSWWLLHPKHSQTHSHPGDQSRSTWMASLGAAAAATGRLDCHWKKHWPTPGFASPCVSISSVSISSSAFSCRRCRFWPLNAATTCCCRRGRHRRWWLPRRPSGDSFCSVPTVGRQLFRLALAKEPFCSSGFCISASWKRARRDSQ